MQRRGVIVAACITLVGVMAGLKILGTLLDKQEDRWARVRGFTMQARVPPAWAGDLDPASAPGWLDIQRRFGLSDADVRLSIRILKANDRYSAGHSLHDLTRYPAQVGRAFAMLAGLGPEMAVNFGTLKSELGQRLASGARFPDEPPGSRYYSNLDPRLLDNTVTLTIIELLHRRRQDSEVQHVLAALASVRPARTVSLPVVMRVVP